MATFKVILREDKKKADGTAPLYLRITQNRKRGYVSLGIYIEARYWNAGAGRVRKSHFRAAAINNQIESTLTDAQLKAAEIRRTRPATAEVLKTAVTGGNLDPGQRAHDYPDDEPDQIIRADHSGRVYRGSRVYCQRIPLPAL